MLSKFIFHYYKKRSLVIIIGFFSLILVDFFQLYIIDILRRAIDYIINNNEYGSKLLYYTLLMIIIAFLIGICRFIWRQIIVGTAHFIVKDFRSSLFSHLQSLNSGFFQKVNIGDIMSRMTNDMQAIRMASSFGMVAGFDGIFFFLTAIIFMLRLNVTLTLLALIPLPVISAISFFAMRTLFKRFKKSQELFSNLTDKVQEMLSGIKIIQAYQQEKDERDNFNKISSNYVNENISIIKIWGMVFPAIFSFSEISTAIILLVGGKFVILDTVSTGELVAFFSYLGMIVWPMMALGFVANIFQRGKASYQRIDAYLNENQEITDQPNAQTIELQGRLSFKNINFTYDSIPVLKNINFDIKKGEYIGIVGKIGCGKSTIAKLLLRILNPQTGTIFYDNIPHPTLKISCIRQSIGYVPQDSFLFSETIEENICFGKKDSTPEEIREVCKIAAVHDNIMELKNNYQTIIGEKGVTLSGGQRQRICIARALIRKPKILILDDALSAVDTKTEKEIINKLKEYVKDITTIVISHRISSFIYADNIMVIEDNTISQQGKHKALLKSSDVYREIYEIQKLSE